MRNLKKQMIILMLFINIIYIHSYYKKYIIIGKSKAPEWNISEWINIDKLTLKELEGKVVVINFFQLWCKGCNNFAIPTVKSWEKRYKNNKNIQFVSIHTVFEGHDVQTVNRLKKFIKDKKITHPVGVDSYISDQRVSETMIKYQNMGTPEIAIIDKKGILRFKKFGSFDIKEATLLIDKLLKE